MVKVKFHKVHECDLLIIFHTTQFSTTTKLNRNQTLTSVPDYGFSFLIWYLHKYLSLSLSLCHMDSWHCILHDHLNCSIRSPLKYFVEYYKKCFMFYIKLNLFSKKTLPFKLHFLLLINNFKLWRVLISLTGASPSVT